MVLSKFFKRSSPRPERGTGLPNHSLVKDEPTIPFPDGVKVLHDCPGAIIDICFIHGLTGNRESTWTADGQPASWPQTLLPSKLDRARILTYGYDAYVVRKSVASTNRLIDHATNLLNDLTTDRASCNASSRHIIFVAHSLGGLVCKETLLLSRNNPEAHLKSIFNCTKGIVFMGTPHAGSWMAHWAKMPISALGIAKSTNKSLLEILETDDQFLESIQLGFLSMIRDLGDNNRRLEVTCFFEELPLPVVGTVVSKSSATFAGYNLISIHADHRNMVKFASADDNGFKRLLGELARWVNETSIAATINEGPPETSSVSATPLSTVPFLQDHDFVGREGVLTRIEGKFKGRNRVALVGLGGIGKSQIAIEYAYQIQHRSPNTSVFWVHANNSSRFIEGYAEIASHFQIPWDDNPEKLLRLAYEALRDKRHGNWLMILDNADDFDVLFKKNMGDKANGKALSSFLPQASHGTILATSRNTECVDRLGMAYIKVEEMNESEAIALLRAKLPDLKPSEDDCRQLVLALGRIPLAITQAAAYIRTRYPAVSIVSYLKLFRQSEANQQRLLKEDGEGDRRDGDADNAVITTWLISFKQIDQTNSYSTDYLSFMSVLDGHGIPKKLLPINDDFEFVDDISPLLHFSMVSTQTDESFTMNRLVQFATKMWLNDKGETGSHIQSAVDTVWEAQDNWTRKQELYPHVEALALNYLGLTEPLKDKMWDNTDTIESIRNLATMCQEVGSPAQAVLLLKEVVERSKERVGATDFDVLDSTVDLAAIYNYMGMFTEAERLASNVIRLSKEHVAENEDSVLRWKSVLASISASIGELDRAERLAAEITARSEEIAGPEDETTLSYKHQLASIYYDQGKLGIALDLGMTVMEAKKRILGESDPVTLDTMNLVALVHEEQGRYSDARDVWESIVRAWEVVFGKNHPNTLSCLSNLASVYEKLGMFAEAEESILSVIVESKKAFGEDHRDVLLSEGNCASIYRSRGRLEEAAELGRQVLATRKKTLKKGHRDILIGVTNLATTYREQGKLAEAEKLQLEARQFERKQYPHLVLAAEHNLAAIWRERGLLQEAGELGKEVWDGREREFGGQHPMTLATMSDMVLICQMQGQWDKAEELGLRARALREEVLGANHPDTWTSMEILAKTYQNQGRQEEAEKLGAAVRDKREARLGLGHPSTRRIIGFMEELAG